MTTCNLVNRSKNFGGTYCHILCNEDQGRMFLKKMLISFHQAIWNRISEDHNVNIHSHGNLTYHGILMSWKEQIKKFWRNRWFLMRFKERVCGDEVWELLVWISLRCNSVTAVGNKLTHSMCLKMGLGLVNRFIDHLQVITTNNCNAIAISTLYCSLEHSLVFSVCY
jgi:hypothetical protein